MFLYLHPCHVLDPSLKPIVNIVIQARNNPIPISANIVSLEVLLVKAHQFVFLTLNMSCLIICRFLNLVCYLTFLTDPTLLHVILYSYKGQQAPCISINKLIKKKLKWVFSRLLTFLSIKIISHSSTSQ